MQENGKRRQEKRRCGKRHQATPVILSSHVNMAIHSRGCGLCSLRSSRKQRKVSDLSQIKQDVSRSHQGKAALCAGCPPLFAGRSLQRHFLPAHRQGAESSIQQRDLSLQKAGVARGKFLSPRSTIQNVANDNTLGENRKLYILV